MTHRGIYLDARDKPHFSPKKREMGHPHCILFYTDREMWATRPRSQILRSG